MTIYENTLNITADSKEGPLLVVYVSSRGHGPAVNKLLKPILFQHITHE